MKLDKGRTDPEFTKELIGENIYELNMAVGPGVTLHAIIDSEYQEVDLLVGPKNVLSLAGLPKVENLIEVLKECRRLLEQG